MLEAIQSIGTSVKAENKNKIEGAQAMQIAALTFD